MILLSHPTGNANVRAVARAFHAKDLLHELDSCICWDLSSFVSRHLPLYVAEQLGRRSFPGISLKLQHSHPWREFGRLISVGLPIPWLRNIDHYPFSLEAVYRSFDRHVAKRLRSLSDLRAVYAYEDGALLTFQAAERLNLSCVYDLPIGYWRAAQKIFQEESDLQPEWACTLTGLNDSPAKLARKDEELKLADLVVVPSSFVKSTLLEYSATSSPVAVVPFGCPLILGNNSSPPAAGPLRVLYVGSLGQRKGLSYALEAVNYLGDQVRFTMIGRVTSPDCTPLLAALDQHSWIESLTHNQILEQMRQHDVLLLPSLFEGFALVINEALSQGLPVIATANSGASEVVRDGVEGFIVPIRSSQAIAERLLQLATNRDQLESMRRSCLRTAKFHTWAIYEQAISALLVRHLNLKDSSL